MSVLKVEINNGYVAKPLGGVKYDEGKLRYDLLPPLALQELTKVLTYGSKKYDDDNWRDVADWKKRYFAASQRHQWQWKQGKILDDETDAKGSPGSNCHHIAAAIASLMFLLEKELESKAATTDSTAFDKLDLPLEKIKKEWTESSLYIGMKIPSKHFNIDGCWVITAFTDKLTQMHFLIPDQKPFPLDWFKTGFILNELNTKGTF